MSEKDTEQKPAEPRESTSPAALIGYGTVFVVVALIAQFCAYSASWLTAQNPLDCIFWPFGSCSQIMASGYSVMARDWFELSHSSGTDWGRIGHVGATILSVIGVTMIVGGVVRAAKKAAVESDSREPRET